MDYDIAMHVNAAGGMGLTSLGCLRERGSEKEVGYGNAFFFNL